MANLEIKISDLYLIMNHILDHIENDLHQAKIEFDKDNYWDVTRQERYDFTKTPQNFEHAQLTDDWEFLSVILMTKTKRLR
jgi:hypothetical protein